MFQESVRYLDGDAPENFRILNIWLVRADVTYDSHPANTAGDTVVAVRTFEGQGSVELKDGTVLQPQKGTVLLVMYRDLMRYRCPAGIWNFMWFECSFGRPDVLPLGRVCDLAAEAGEERELEELYDVLASHDPPQTIEAASRLKARIGGWIRCCAAEVLKPRLSGAVQDAVNYMHGHLDGIDLEELASRAFLGERRFRSLFKEQTGKTPHQYFSDLRMQTAARLLLRRTEPMKEIAGRLGFSSPYHFSNAFKKHFGVSPRRYLLRAAGA